MQHTIQLDSQTEQNLSQIAMNSGKSADDILLAAIKDFLQKQSRQQDLERFLKPYQIDLNDYTYDREKANER